MDGTQAFGPLYVSGDVPLGARETETHEERDVRLARENCLRAGILDALVAGIPAVVLIAMQLPLSPGVLVAVFGTAILPFTVAVAVLGPGSTPIPFITVGLFSATALLGSYLCLLMGRLPTGNPFPDAWAAAMFIGAVVPIFAALWSAWVTPPKSERQGSLPCAPIAFVTIALVAMVAVLAPVSAAIPSLAVQPWIIVSLYIAILLPPVIANWVQARRDKKLPVRLTDKQPDHISGVGATTFILFVVVIVTLGLWAAATGVNAQISRWAGVIVLAGLLVAFAIVAFGLPAQRHFGRLYLTLKAWAKPVGWVFSSVDSLLVYAVANALGTNEKNPWLRYPILVGSLLPCAALGWWLPAPYGLIPVSLALIGTIAIARRWAWVEEDRENAMLARKFVGSHIRVGFSQDLKDEALIGFMFLFLVVPIGLRQMHLAFGNNVFVVESAADVDSLLSWLSLFGTELAKAVPFVDWAEIYQVEGDGAIRMNESVIGMGQHVVFGTRVLVDLVLLAAFLQAVSITQRTRKLKDMFYLERSLNRLDPFVEAHELGKLARFDGARFQVVEPVFSQFPVYDPDRLEELKLKGERDEIGFVAAMLLERDENGGPEELLSREARREKPDLDRCVDLVTQVADQDQVQVPALKTAHYALVRYPTFMPVRRSIAEQLARALPDQRAINALSEILIGPGPNVQDPRREVRAVALNALFRQAVAGNKVAQASVRHAAAHDTTAAIKAAAREMLEYSSDW